MISIKTHQIDLATLATAFQVLGQQNGLSSTYWNDKAREAMAIVEKLESYHFWNLETLTDIRDRLDHLAGACEALTDVDCIPSDDARQFWLDRCNLILGLSDHLTDQIHSEPAAEKSQSATA